MVAALKRILGFIVVVVAATTVFQYLQHAPPSRAASSSEPAAAAPAGKPDARSASASAPAAPAPSPPKSLAGNVDLTNSRYTRNEITFDASFTVNNKNPGAVKDIEVTCRHYAKSGTEIRVDHPGAENGVSRRHGGDRGERVRGRADATAIAARRDVRVVAHRLSTSSRCVRVALIRAWA